MPKRRSPRSSRRFPRTGSGPIDRAQIGEWRTAWRLAEVEPRRLLEADLLDPRDVVIALQEELPADVVVLAEPGTPTPNVSAYWECPEPGRTVIDPRGHGPMGYVIPAAMGVSMADPERPVVGLCGDGSFAMACGELETANRLQLPVLYVQFTNNSLGWIKMLQHLYLDQRYFSVDPGPMNYVGVAQAMGLDAIRVNDLEPVAGSGPRVADPPPPNLHRRPGPRRDHARPTGRPLASRPGGSHQPPGVLGPCPTI